MAISYDSSGNPQVDFAWGNMPLQGNAQRGVVEPVVKQTYNYQPDWDGSGGIFAINLASATEVNAGWTITATAGPSTGRITKKFTVESVSMGSPGYYVHTKEAYDQEFATATMVTMTGEFITSIAPALNRGGGAGDKGWSQTTLVKSPELDPALDNHVLATNGWNGYPGYTAGVNKPPALLTATVAAPYASNFQFLSHTGPYNYSTMQTVGSGFTVQTLLNYAEMTNGEDFLSQVWPTLKEAIDNNTVSGRTIKFSNVLLQGMTPEPNYAPTFNDVELPLLGAWYHPDGYGNYTVVFNVAPGTVGQDFTPGNQYLNTFGASQEFTFEISGSRNVALEIVFNDPYGHNQGGDAVWATYDYMTYDGSWKIYSNNLTSTQTTALTNGSLVGKFIGFSKLTQETYNNGGGWQAERACSQVLAVSGPNIDEYNNTYYTITAQDNSTGDSAAGAYVYTTGDTLVVI